MEEQNLGMPEVQQDTQVEVQNKVISDTSSEKNVDVFAIFDISWKTFKENASFLIVLTLIYFGIRFAEALAEKYTGKGSVIILEIILIAAFNILIGIGMVQIYLKISRGSKANFGEIIGSTKYFWRLLGGSILYGLIVLAGYLLLIIPGIIWQYKYSMFSYLIIDKDMRPMDAIKESGRIMQGFKWKLFFLQLLMFVVAIVGLLLLGIGLLAAIPVMTLMQITFYRIISGERISA